MWRATYPYVAVANEKLNLAQGDWLLEVAAGTGTCVVPLAERVKEAGMEDVRITATDLSPGLLEKLKANATASGVDNLINTEVMDALALNLPDGSVSHVACMFTLMLVPDRSRATSELLRVLQPGGIAVVMTWESNPVMRLVTEIQHELAPDHPPFRIPLDTHESLFEELTRAGFQDVTVERVVQPFDMTTVDMNVIMQNPAIGAVLSKFSEAEVRERATSILRGLTSDGAAWLAVGRRPGGA